MTGGPHSLTGPLFGHAPSRAQFDDAAFARAMIRTEIALAQAQAGLGLVPESAASAIAQLPLTAPDTALAAGVANAGVPVPALLTHLRTHLPAPAADWLHHGATSQDIIDTAMCLCAQAALSDLGTALATLIDRLHTLSTAHADTLMLARTRGQLATPITFGLRVAHWAQPLIALDHQRARLATRALRVQLGGASGSLSSMGDHGPAIAARMAAQLALTDSPPWHTDRSGLRELAGWLVRLVTATGKIGRDVALMARGEIGEVRVAGGGGSSTMPHKSNPIAAETLQALVPLALGYDAGLAASALHAEERDGAAWPVEWALLPMLFETAGAALNHATALLAALQVDTAALRARATADPAVLAEAAVFALAPHLGRAEATRRVTAALATGQPLPQALGPQPGLDWDSALSDAAFTAPAARIAQRIFARKPE